MKLGVNIDHAATIRQQRGTPYPDLAEIVRLAEAGGADGITLHLREDRRHIQDDDVFRLAGDIRSKMNLEMAATEPMQKIALEAKPTDVCLVPEKREELTTEGGLDAAAQCDRLRAYCQPLTEAGITVSLFVEPSREQLDAAVAIGAPVVELHTGTYADSEGQRQQAELEKLHDAAVYAHAAGLTVNAGHGLHLDNVSAICRLPGMNELNIGHAIIARALIVGMQEAVREMKQRIEAA